MRPLSQELKDQYLKAGDRVDVFTREGLYLIQSPKYFTASLDAFLLAQFVQLPKRRGFHYLDFCSGNGVIPILLSSRTQAPLAGIEIQADLVDMGRRSIALNGLTQQVSLVQGDIKSLARPRDFLYDVISCNPPHFSLDHSHKTHHLTSHAIARHEVLLTLEDWIGKARQILKTKGKLFFVHRPQRLDQITAVLLHHGFAIHRVQFVHSFAGSEAKLVLVEAIYQGGRQGVKVLPALTVHQADGSYTEEMLAIYYD